MKKVLLIMLALAMAVTGAAVYLNHRREENYVHFTGETWYDHGIGQYIPTMKLRSGEAPRAKGVVKNSDRSMYFRIDNASGEEDFNDYVELLTDAGFVYDARQTASAYTAADRDDHQVKVHHWKNGTITVEASCSK